MIWLIYPYRVKKIQEPRWAIGSLNILHTDCENGLYHIDGLVQDCSVTSALAMEIMQSCIKPSI